MCVCGGGGVGEGRLTWGECQEQRGVTQTFKLSDTQFTFKQCSKGLYMVPRAISDSEGPRYNRKWSWARQWTSLVSALGRQRCGDPHEFEASHRGGSFLCKNAEGLKRDRGQELLLEEGLRPLPGAILERWST